MTTLHDLFDYDKFLQQVATGDIVVRKNSSGALSIANYGPTVQYGRNWTPETRASRGLIYNSDTLEVLARPWEKFFNWDDSISPYPPSGSVILSEKFDGSMGILYLDEECNEFKVASRGSFTSEQAVKATQMFNDLDDDHRFSAYAAYFSGHTVLFEIIYPENRIVLDYGSEDRLVLLDVLNTSTGMPAFDVFDDMYWLDKADKTLLPGFMDTLAGDIPKNKEGFVLYWPHYNFRCKVKGAEYITLHSILTETSSRKIWQYSAVNACRGLGTAKELGNSLSLDVRDVQAILAVGDDWFSHLIKDVPDEFYAWVERTVDAIHENVDANLLEIRQGVQTVMAIDSADPRRQFESVSTSTFCANILGIARKADNAENRAFTAAWKNAMPAFEKPFARRN